MFGNGALAAGPRGGVSPPPGELTALLVTGSSEQWIIWSKSAHISASADRSSQSRKCSLGSDALSPGVNLDFPKLPN
jgi:hypothetical protein